MESAPQIVLWRQLLPKAKVWGEEKKKEQKVAAE
jgi:hypothetical protein